MSDRRESPVDEPLGNTLSWWSACYIALGTQLSTCVCACVLC